MGSADDTIVSDLMEAQKDGYIVAYPCHWATVHENSRF